MGVGLRPKSQRQLCDLVIKSQGRWSANVWRVPQALLGADDSVDYKPSTVITAMQAGLENEGQGFDAWHDRLGEDQRLRAGTGSVSHATACSLVLFEKDIMAIETKAYEAVDKTVKMT